MTKQSEFNLRQRLFLLKVSACLFGLLIGFFILAPKASMQDEPETGAANVPVVVNNSMMNGNYRPTPEPPKSTVRGRVFYADTGRPVKRVSLMFIPENVSGGPGQSPSALTDNEGNFQMKAVQAGTYYAIVNAPGVYSPLAFFDFSVSRNRGSEKEAFKKAFEGFEPIQVDGVTETVVQIPARRGGAIGGRVIYDDGDAAIGVKVEILRRVEDRFMSSIPNFSALSSMRMGGGVFQTDDRGVYRFAGLPPGDYIVKVSENVSHAESVERRYYDAFEGSLGGKSFVSIFYPDVSDTKSAQLITVASGQEVSEINLTLPSRNLYRIEGKTVARKDKSPVKAQISIKRKNQEEVYSILDEIGGGRQQAASTDENGDWKFKELPKGTYTLTVEPVNEDRDDESYRQYSNSNTTNGAPGNAPPKPKLAKRVYEVIVEDKDLSEIVIELGYGATVSGTVTTENNQEMPSVVNVAAHNVKSEEVDASTTVYNGGGMARENSKLKKSNHDFKLEGVAEGQTELKILINDDNFYVKSAMFNGTDLLANPIELKEGEMLRNVQIVVVKGTGTLKGAVLDDAKTPVKNVQFNLVPVNAVKRKNLSFYRTAQTGENGEFELKAAPAEYAVIFDSKEYSTKKGDEFQRWLDEAVKNAVKVTVKANETEKVSLTAPK